MKMDNPAAADRPTYYAEAATWAHDVHGGLRASDGSPGSWPARRQPSPRWRPWRWCLWYSDLRDYTRISDAAAPDAIIPMLNDYAEAVISSVQEAGGDVLKLIGDGILAIFTEEDSASAATAALKAQMHLRKRVVVLNKTRKASGAPATDVYLGVHIGEVFYGNIGSDTRLDFTVVGPAVNEVSRIASMCRSVDQDVLLSDRFAAALPEELRAKLVSVGRFALRGVGRAQELFTLDPIILEKYRAAGRAQHAATQSQ